MAGCRPPFPQGSLIGPPPGGASDSFLRAVVTATGYRDRADHFYAKGDNSGAYTFYCLAAGQAISAYRRSRSLELARRLYARDVYRQLKRTVALMPYVEGRADAIERDEMRHLGANDITSIETSMRNLACKKVNAVYPVTPHEVKLSEEENGKSWWSKHSGRRDPIIVASRQEAQVAVEERLRLLGDWVARGEGPPPPHIREIVKELRRKGVIGKPGKR